MPGPYFDGGPVVDVPADTLPYLVLRLPQPVRDELARGPSPDDNDWFGCRVCEALDELVTAHDRTAEMLFDYHNAEGDEGEACYRRCCDIYRAAGWTE